MNPISAASLCLPALALAALTDVAGAQCRPSAPTSVRASDGTRCVGVDITWNEPSGTVLFYNVYRGTTSTNATNLIAAVPVPRYTDLLSGSNTFYYRVKAVGPCGSSGYSGANSGYAGLKKPTGLAATYATHCQRVEITWNTVTGATLYEVRRNVEPVFETSILAGTSAIGQLRDLVVPGGDEWYYWVIARGVCTSEPAGPVVGVRGEAPGAPDVTTATDPCQTGITVRWSGTESLGTVRPVTYTIRRHTDGNILGSEVIAELESPESSYFDRSAARGTQYYYWVVAENACGIATNFTAAPGQWVSRAYLAVAPWLHHLPVGARAEFRASVSAGPQPQTWVWYHSGLGLLRNGGNIQGADGPTLIVDPIRPENEGSYFAMAVTCIGEQTGAGYLAIRESAGCYADCDSSSGIGVLDAFDFLCFQSRYAQSDPYACDCDTSTGAGVCDVFDFLCFQNAFAGGCP